MSESSILIVEDDPNSARFVEQLLRKAGLSEQISIAQDGLEAVNLLFSDEQDGSLPSLIILDLLLPQVSGADILKRLRMDARTQAIPIIIFTALTGEKQMASTYYWGANSFLPKPIVPHDLVAAVRYLLTQ